MKNFLLTFLRYFCSCLTGGICCFFYSLFLFYYSSIISEGLYSKPFASYLHPEPGIKQDMTCCLELALFWHFGFLPISFADLEMKNMEWDLWRQGKAVLPSSWQSWSLMLLCLALDFNLLSLQPITGGFSCPLIMSLKLKFVRTY